MSGLAFLDTETTGLYEHVGHEVWEVGLILRDSGGDEVEYLWQLPVNLARADPASLQIGRFHERRWPEPSGSANHATAVTGDWTREGRSLMKARLFASDMGQWAEHFARLTWGAHLVGAVPSFDERFLAPLLRRHGACPGWHYHLVDVEALAAGWLAGHGGPADANGYGYSTVPPWDSERLSAGVGVDPEQYDRHTAMGDAEWARDMYLAVLGR